MSTKWNTIPMADTGIIGGSSTFSVDFPASLDNKSVTNVEGGLAFDTPFGESPVFTHFEFAGSRILYCKMHGWRAGVSRADASRQLYWVFRQAGVKNILAEGGVGSCNHLLNPRDIIIPTDYIDNSMRKDVSLGTSQLLIMREPLCGRLSAALLSAAQDGSSGRVFERGIYAVTDGRHFESRAEVAMLRQWGADVIGQSMCPEVYLAREIGACYAGLYLIVNYAEGVVEDWRHEELAEIFYGEAKAIGKIMLDTITRLNSDSNGVCQCAGLRKETLLKED